MSSNFFLSDLSKALRKGFSRISEQEGTTPLQEVAKVILKAITSENPNMRYMGGNDAIQLLEAKKRMADLEFEGFIKQQFFSSSQK
jgi:hypothetical protein